MEESGRVWFRDALSKNVLEELDRAFGRPDTPGKRFSIGTAKHAAPNAMATITSLARKILSRARPVRFVIFDKSDSSNWALPWHQDRVIAVKEKLELGGFKSWTSKSGIWHVEPPMHILANMFFARVHLDDTDTKNGCLQIARGSHVEGMVPDYDTAKVAQNYLLENCVASRGDVLMVKALTLHGSQASRSMNPRRTLRIDFSDEELPGGLKWDS